MCELPHELISKEQITEQVTALAYHWNWRRLLRMAYAYLSLRHNGKRHALLDARCRWLGGHFQMIAK